MFDKVSHKNLNDVVYETLKQSIMEDQLKPGEKLNIEKICKQLGVSRTPVSNAMQALERDGYVVIIPQNGTYVKELSLEEIKVIYEMREVIEGLIARLIITKVDKRKLELLYEQFSKLLKSDDEEVIHEYFELDLQFHDVLMSYCPPIIKKETQNIIDLTKRSRKLNLQFEIDEKGLSYIKEKGIKNHMKIIEALLAKDTEKAEMYSKQDVKETKEEVLKYLYPVNRTDEKEMDHSLRYS